MSSEQDERREMVHDFVTESREMLDDIEPQILALEKHASQSGDIDDEILNTIFRLFHSLKGMASFLDLQTVMQVTHEAETLLDIFRKRQMPMEGEHVELLCRTSDFVRDLLDVIEQRLSDNGYEDAAGKRLTILVGQSEANAVTSFRFASEGKVETFYWIDEKLSYAVTGEIPRDLLRNVADDCYQQFQTL